MTDEELRELYAVVMSYDNRKLSQANLMAWREQADRNRWTLAEAKEAVHQHYAESPDFLQPAHITAQIRAARQQPAPAKQVIEEFRDPAQPQHIRKVLRDVGRRLGWDRTQKGHPALDHKCPHCGAGAGRPCTRQLGRGHRSGQWVPIKEIHDKRLKLVEENS